MKIVIISLLVMFLLEACSFKSYSRAILSPIQFDDEPFMPYAKIHHNNTDYYLEERIINRKDYVKEANISVYTLNNLKVNKLQSLQELVLTKEGFEKPYIDKDRIAISDQGALYFWITQNQQQYLWEYKLEGEGKIIWQEPIDSNTNFIKMNYDGGQLYIEYYKKNSPAGITLLRYDTYTNQMHNFSLLENQQNTVVIENIAFYEGNIAMMTRDKHQKSEFWIYQKNKGILNLRELNNAYQTNNRESKIKLTKDGFLIEVSTDDQYELDIWHYDIPKDRLQKLGTVDNLNYYSNAFKYKDGILVRHINYASRGSIIPKLTYKDTDEHIMLYDYYSGSPDVDIDYFILENDEVVIAIYSSFYYGTISDLFIWDGKIENGDTWKVKKNEHVHNITIDLSTLHEQVDFPTARDSLKDFKLERLDKSDTFLVGYKQKSESNTVERNWAYWNPILKEIQPLEILKGIENLEVIFPLEEKNSYLIHYQITQKTQTGILKLGLNGEYILD